MTQQLALKLLDANTEAELDEVIAADLEMSKPSNWYPLDGRDTNFNVVNNQSSNGAKAATELMTNMVDAILMKHCYIEEIDPKGAAAPATMYEAVDKFIFKLNGGKIIKGDNKELSDFALKNLIIGVTGGKTSRQSNPCLTFCDNGEGQHPNNFNDTFLSLKAKNKSQIPFVQGKYNMGSSGVLGFCGARWYKLIISRRFDGKGDWGWTLLRRKAASSGMDYVEFFAPKKEIQKFSMSAPIKPFLVNKGRDRYNGFQLETGTIVKLYEYFLGRNFTGFRGTREAFNENLVETILPFRILDFRQKPEKNRGKERELGIDGRPFYGMEYLLLRSHAEDEVLSTEDESEQETSSNAEGKTINIGVEKHPQLGEIRASVIVIKKAKEKTGWYQTSNSRIFHHVNGQVMYKGTRGFLTQCGFPALKDRAVIMIDSSALTDSTHQDLWKGDRESIRETGVGELYKDVIKDIIKKSTVLKDLNHRIANEELETATKDSSRELVQELVKNDENFKMLLDGQVPDLPSPVVQPDEELRTDLKRNPTYIKLKSLSDLNISIPANRRGRLIHLETDANDDFFTRPDNIGRLTIDNDAVVSNFSWDFNLYNGNLTVFLKRENVQIGDRFSFRICMESDEMPSPVCLEKEIKVEIIEPKPKQPRPPSPPPAPEPSVGLPRHRLLTKDGRYVMGEKSVSWAEFDGYADCDEKDGGYISDLGDAGKLYLINYDNASFQNYLRHAKNEKSAAEKKFILGMRILMLGMEFGLNQTKDSPFSEHIDEVRRALAKGAAATVLTLCDQLPKHFDLFKDKLEDDTDGS